MDDDDFTIDDILVMKKLGIPDISIKKIVGSKLYKKYVRTYDKIHIQIYL